MSGSYVMHYNFSFNYVGVIFDFFKCMHITIMRIDEVNKDNILGIDNNLGVASHTKEWIGSYPELGFEILIVNENFKIYKEEHSKFSEIYVVTDIANNVLHWIYVYDYYNRYETKYEYILFSGTYNYHIDKKNGELNQYARR